MLGLILLVVPVATLAYTLFLFSLGSRATSPPRVAPDDLIIFFMVPCLNEELVIEKTIERLQKVTGVFAHILIIDDGSDDATASIASRYESDRVKVFRRTAPDARRGKGEALNAAFRYLRDLVIRLDIDPSSVVLAVLDADGRLDPGAAARVAPYFRDRRRGAVQIKVRINNASESLLARMQDIEFAAFTEVFQKARSQLGSSGLGGNGQFARLSALMDLGDAPWTDCLTEDLELGIRLLLAGHTNGFDDVAVVSQQGLNSARPLIRQRSRWFQGHLQCLKTIPDIIRSDLPKRTRLDLIYHLMSPVIMLSFQIVSLTTLAVVATKLVLTGPAQLAATFAGPTLAIVYVLAFGMVPAVAISYWRTAPDVGIVTGLLYAHLYILFTHLWLLAGAWAVLRQMKGAKGWAKTQRNVEGPVHPLPLPTLSPMTTTRPVTTARKAA